MPNRFHQLFLALCLLLIALIKRPLIDRHAL